MNYKNVVINLARREDRKTEFMERKPLDMPVEVFTALDGKTFETIQPENAREEKLLQVIRQNPTARLRGEVCCALSHYRVWKKLLQETEHNFFVVFEDDAFFTNNYETVWKKFLESFQAENVDFVFIGGRPSANFGNGDIRILHVITPGVYRIPGVNPRMYQRTLHSYIITRKGAEKLCRLFEEATGFHAMDHWVTEQYYKVRMGDVFPHMCWSPFDYKTDIQIGT